MYESYFPYYEEKELGLPIISKDDVNQTQLFINYPDYGVGYVWDGGGLRVGYGTGRYGQYQGRVIAQVFLEFSEYSYGWVYADEFRAGQIGGKGYKTEDLQSLINTIIQNNQNIVIENLISARLVQNIEKKGKQVPEDVKETIRQLQTRVNERDTQLSKNEYFQSRKVGSPDMPAEYISALNSLMGKKIGLVLTLSVTTVIAISILVGAAIATALYFAFRGSANQSASDYKLAKKTQDILNKMDPKEAAQIEKEIKSSWNQGYKIGSKGTIKNIGLFAAGIGIFFLAKPVGERLGIVDKK